MKWLTRWLCRHGLHWYIDRVGRDEFVCTWCGKITHCESGESGEFGGPDDLFGGGPKPA